MAKPADTNEAEAVAFFTMNEVAKRLRKTRRWLQDQLREHPEDSRGVPFFRNAGRSKLFTEESITRL